VDTLRQGTIGFRTRPFAVREQGDRFSLSLDAQTFVLDAEPERGLAYVNALVTTSSMSTAARPALTCSARRFRITHRVVLCDIRHHASVTQGRKLRGALARSRLARRRTAGRVGRRADASVSG